MSYHLLPRVDTDLPSPSVSGKASYRTSSKLRLLAFFGTAAASGILFHILLLGFTASPSSRQVQTVPWDTAQPPAHPWGAESGPERPPATDIDTSLPPNKTEKCDTGAVSSYVRPGLGHYVVPNEDEWSLDRVREMVAGTKGYYVRDYSLGLGWNNVRIFGDMVGDVIR